MTPRSIGYYVHHHGDGHRQRALALADHMQGRAVLMGTDLEGRTGPLRAIGLPDDRLAGHGFDGRDGQERPDALHYAPIDHDGVRRRVARITAWIADARPALMVIDVSVEIAMLARLASVPTVYVRLGGRRDDPAHLDAFRGAAALLAPFHASLDDPDLPAWIIRKTIYAPGLAAHSPASAIDERRVIGVVGRGGTAVDGEAWAAAARATPTYNWRVIGPCLAPRNIPANLEFAGWIADASDEIAAAGIVVGAAGDGIVSAVIAARRPFICIPEARPFDEQQAKAARLSAIGGAIVCATWPRPDAWAALLMAAKQLDPARLREIDDTAGAAHAATRLMALADTDAQNKRQRR